MKRIREGARVVLVDARGRVLLLHFVYRRGPLAGTDYWGLPGGGIEPGETPERAAVRELGEETGVRVDGVGAVRAESRYDFRLSSGEDVVQRDYYFLVRLDGDVAFSRDGFTPEEAETMAEARWWVPAELAATGERLIPSNMAEMVARVMGEAR